MKAFILIISLAFVGCSSMSKSSFELPDYKNKVQSNGSKVLTIVDNSLPSFSAYAMVGMGHIHDPDGKEGLSNFVVSMLDKGTKNYTAPKLAEKVDQLGARLQLSSSNDFAFISIQGLSIHQDELLEILQEVLTLPKFSTSEIKRQRSQILANIVQRNDEPSTVASDAFDKMIYKSKHPYSSPSVGSIKSIKQISRTDLVRHYKKHFVSKNISFAFSGRLGENFQAKVKKFLEPIANGEKVSAKSLMSKKTDEQTLLVYKSDLKQTQVRIGHVAIQRSNPDYLKLKVATTILGGAFSSRLNDEIREKRGLTYGIRSSFNPGLYNGPFIISSSTRNEKAGELVNETKNLVNSFVKDGITSDELNMAVGYLKGTFPSLIETPEGLAFNILTLQYYGVGVDYLKDYIKNLESYSKSDIHEAVKKHIHPSKMQTLIYAPQSVESQFKDSKNFTKKPL